jgi:antitoxin component of MazEF toxin-antitoxin module
MKTQIKKWGDSNVLVLSPDFMKFHSAKVGDWINLDDTVLVSDQLNSIKEEAND